MAYRSTKKVFLFICVNNVKEKWKNYLRRLAYPIQVPQTNGTIQENNGGLDNTFPQIL